MSQREHREASWKRGDFSWLWMNREVRTYDSGGKISRNRYGSYHEGLLCVHELGLKGRGGPASGSLQSSKGDSK